MGTVINLKHLNRYLEVTNIRTTELKILNNGCLQLNGVPVDLETELCYYIAPLTPTAMEEHAPNNAVLPTEELAPAK